MFPSFNPSLMNLMVLRGMQGPSQEGPSQFGGYPSPVRPVQGPYPAQPVNPAQPSPPLQPVGPSPWLGGGLNNLMALNQLRRPMGIRQ